MTDPASMALVPQDWMAELENAVFAAPKVLTKEALDAGFVTYNDWATMGFQVRNRMEAFGYLTFYAIHKHKLWKSKFDTWEAYCDATALQAFAPGKRTIKAKVSTIGALVMAGVGFEQLVSSLADRPTATEELANTPASQLSEPIADVLARWGEDGGISAHQANTDLEEMTGKPHIWCSLAEYYKDTKVLALTIVMKPQDDDSTEIYHRIEDVGLSIAEWYVKKMDTRLTFRESKKESKLPPVRRKAKAKGKSAPRPSSLLRRKAKR